MRWNRSRNAADDQWAAVCPPPDGPRTAAVVYGNDGPDRPCEKLAPAVRAAQRQAPFKPVAPGATSSVSAKRSPAQRGVATGGDGNVSQVASSRLVARLRARRGPRAGDATERSKSRAQPSSPESQWFWDHYDHAAGQIIETFAAEGLSLSTRRLLTSAAGTASWISAVLQRRVRASWSASTST